jgi:hypothetical protein
MLNLYFQSQLGFVLLQGVEAYVIEGMNANLLIGEDTHHAWQLHTMRPEHEAYWQVGNSKHWIPTSRTTQDKEAFVASWHLGDEPLDGHHIDSRLKECVESDSSAKPHPGKGKVIVMEDVCIPEGHIAQV